MALQKARISCMGWATESGALCLYASMGHHRPVSWYFVYHKIITIHNYTYNCRWCHYFIWGWRNLTLVTHPHQLGCDLWSHQEEQGQIAAVLDWLYPTNGVFLYGRCLTVDFSHDMMCILVIRPASCVAGSVTNSHWLASALTTSSGCGGTWRFWPDSGWDLDVPRGAESSIGAL